MLLTAYTLGSYGLGPHKYWHRRSEFCPGHGCMYTLSCV